MAICLCDNCLNNEGGCFCTVYRAAIFEDDVLDQCDHYNPNKENNDESNPD